MAASSSSAAAILPQQKYDVFLSFRGEDTRQTFISHLHTALLGKKIVTYIDDRLERGGKIGPALLEAIEKSKISVIIFSKNYASSTWCLDELAHILDCRERYGQIVVPIFYGVDPSHVRKQKKSYKVAFAQLEERFKDSMDKVHKWRAALKEAADMSGFPNYSNKAGTEADLVEKVVKDVLTKLNRKSSSDLKGLVGIESQIEQIESLLCIDSSADVLTVGIWGMGGIGKTTLADAVFHRISSKFEASSFLRNVRANSEAKDGVYELRNVLLREILNDESINIKTPSIGLSSVRERLSRTKSLIVLDDVNDSSQLEILAGDHIPFCSGSRIIVTTRDRGLLRGWTDDRNIYEVKGLERDEALQLFHSLAFKKKSPTRDCTKWSKKVVDHVKGVPLALKILGSLFISCSTAEDWKAEWKTLKKFPNGKIQDVLRHSYNGLEDNEKEIFLDIACFYKGLGMDFVKRRVDIHGFCADVGIRRLIDKSLISIEYYSKWPWQCYYFEMHDLLQEMGQAIVREQCIEEPGQRDRLFIPEDVHHVLSNNTGTAKVRCISLPSYWIEGVLNISGAAFEKMYNLRLLSIIGTGSFGEKLEQALQSLPNSLRCFDWYQYPLKSLPSKFSTENLVELHMPRSQVVALLWNKDQNLEQTSLSVPNLKWIDLRDSIHLTEIADLSRCPKLEHIDFNRCSNLQYLSEMPGSLKFLNLSSTAIKQLPLSVWSMEKLRFLDITHCKALEILPSGSCMLKLDHCLSFTGCSSIAKFWNLPIYTRELNLSFTPIKVLPSSIECLSALVEIKLTYCKKLSSLEFRICKLKSLQRLDMCGCSQFEYFPEILEPMEQLQFLDLSSTAIKQLPSSIGNLIGLVKIELKDCHKLSGLEISICKLKSLQRLDMSGCFQFEYFPKILEPMEQLQFLDLSSTAIKQLPSSIGNLIGLVEIKLKHCRKLSGLEISICKLKSLQRLDMYCCTQFEYFPEILEPMKQLQFLNLSFTSIKQLPSSIGNLIGLHKLCLNGSLIENIPASIKQASRLRSLFLINCKGLQSLPELPGLFCLQARGCTSLKTVASSRTFFAQGSLDECENVETLHQLIFFNCVNLDENARRNIMADAQLRIMKAATATKSLEFKKGDYKKESFSSESSLTIICPGNEIPNWFSYQNEGSSMNIKLPPDWFSGGFLGFALSVVAAKISDHMDDRQFSKTKPKCNFGCRFSLKINNCEEIWNSYECGHDYLRLDTVSDHVLMWYNFFDLEKVAKSSTLFYNVVPEVSVEFYIRERGQVRVPEIGELKKCGMSLVYARDAEKLKSDIMKIEEGAMMMKFTGCFQM